MSRFDLFGDSVSVGEVIDAYLGVLSQRVAAGAFSKDHLSNIRLALQRFGSFLGRSTSVSACRQFDISRWMAENAQWKSTATKRNAVGSVIAAFRFAEEEQMIARSPYRRPRSLRNLLTQRRTPAKPSEYLALLAASEPHLRRCLVFLWQTGARTCEMRLLQWAHVRLTPPYPCVILRDHKTARKTGKQRVIPLNSVAAKLLKWMELRSASRFVFTNRNGAPWKSRHSFARSVNRAAQQAGLTDGGRSLVTAYCLRHSFACAALAAGMTSKQVADQLGHVDARMVERVYGSHTAHDAAYLAAVARQIELRRARNPSA